MPVTWSDDKLILLYIAPVGVRTHDLPHTAASNMSKVSHALTHSATAAIIDEDARQGTARVTSLHGGRLHHGCRNDHLNYEKQGDAHPQDDPNECDHRG